MKAVIRIIFNQKLKNMTVTHRLGEDEEYSIRNLWLSSSSLVSLDPDKLSPRLLLNDQVAKKLLTKTE